MPGVRPPQKRVYWLASPAQLKAREDAIRRIVYRVLGVADQPRYAFHVSASSAWLSYVDTARAWPKEPGAPPPATRDAAQHSAEEFVRHLAEAFQSLPEPEATGRVIFVPPLRPLETMLVPRPDRRGWDHWLYRAQPQLRDAYYSFVDVIGTGVEVRIGGGGDVIGFVWRWRPLSSEWLDVEARPLEVAADHHGAERGPGGGSEQTPVHQLVYVAEGDGLPQYYLAPYYLVDSGHTFTLAPASSHSLVVTYGIAGEPQGESKVTALTFGGSGQYDFRWAMHQADLWESDGVRDLGDGSYGSVTDDHNERIATSTVTIPPGSYIVMVNVRDRRTGAFKHHQQLICSFPLLRDRPPERLLVS